MQNNGGKPVFGTGTATFGASTAPASNSFGTTTAASGFNFGSALSGTTNPGGFSFGSAAATASTPLTFGSIPATTMNTPAFGSTATQAPGIFGTPNPISTGLQFGTPASVTPSSGTVFAGTQKPATGLFSGTTSTQASGLFSGSMPATQPTGLFSGKLASTQPSGLFSGSTINTPSSQGIGLFSGTLVNTQASTQPSGLFSGSLISTPATQGTGLFSGKLVSTQSSGLQSGVGGTMTFTGVTNPQTRPPFSFGVPATQPAAVTKAATGPIFGSAAMGTTPGIGFGLGGTSTATPGLTFGTQETVKTTTTPFSFSPVIATTAQGILGSGTTTFGAAGQMTVPSGGFKLGPATSTTGQTITPSAGFNVSTPQSTAATALSLGMATTQGLSANSLGASQTSTAPAFGLGQSTTGFNLSGMLSGQAKTAVTGVAAITVTTSATAMTGLSVAPKTQASLLSTTTSTTTTKPGFILTATTTTASTGFQLGGSPFTSLVAPSSSAATAFKLGPSVSTTATTSTATSSASGSITTATTTTSAEKYTYKQLEDQVNKWNIDLEEMEKGFLEQAAQVNVADRELMENGEKITTLHTEVERAKAEQNRLDQELDFLVSQQNELEDLLKPLEESVKQHDAEYGQEPDREREKIYKMAEKCDGQLKGMVQDLREIIDYLNASNTSQQQEENPVVQIAKILNVHMDSLQWIDQNSALLQKRVDEIARLGEMRKKEQERSFRLGFD